MNVSTKAAKAKASHPFLVFSGFMKKNQKRSIGIMSAIICIVLLLVGYSVYATHVADDFTNKVKSLKEKVVDYDGRDPSIVAKYFEDTPELRSLAGASVISSSYAKAQVTNRVLQQFGHIAQDMKKRQATADSQRIYKKLAKLVTNHRTSQTEILDEMKTKEGDLETTRGVPSISKLAVLRQETYTRIIDDQQKHIDEVNALGATSGLDDVKKYHVGLLEKDMNLSKTYRDQYKNSIKDYSAAERANTGYPLVRQKITDELVISVYAVSVLEREQANLALALQYAMKDNLFLHSSISSEEASVRAVTSVYTRYARYAFVKDLQSASSQTNLGEIYFGLHMANRTVQDASDIRSTVISDTKNKLAAIRTTVDLVGIGQESSGSLTRNVSRIKDTLEVVTDLGELSAFKFASDQVGRSKQAAGVVIDVPNTKKFAYGVIDDTLPISSTIKTEYDRFKSAAKKCVDIRMTYYGVAKKDFEKLNSIDKKQKDLQKSLSANPSEENRTRIRADLDTSEATVADITKAIRKIGDVYKKDVNNCAAELDAAITALVAVTKNKTLFVNDAYDKLVSLTNDLSGK